MADTSVTWTDERLELLKNHRGAALHLWAEKRVAL